MIENYIFWVSIGALVDPLGTASKVIFVLASLFRPDDYVHFLYAALGFDSEQNRHSKHFAFLLFWNIDLD